MFFARKNKSIFFGLLVSIVIFFLIFFAFRFGNIKNNNTRQDNTNVQKTETEKTKILRSQSEIAKEYKENMENLLERVEAHDGDYVSLLNKTSGGLLNIFVPTDLKDDHLNFYNSIISMEEGVDYKDMDDLKKKLSSSIVDLLEKTENLKFN
jgi:hypothetical protein